MKLDIIGYGLLALAAVIAYGHYATRDDTIRRVRAEADSLARAITDSAEVYERQRHDDSARIAQDSSTIARLRRGYGQVIVKTDSILDTLTVLDSAQLEVVRAQIEYERLACRELVDTLQSQRDTAYSRELFWQEAQRATYQQAQVYQGLLHEALQAKRPNNLVRGMLIGGAVVGAVVLLR